MNKEFEKRRRKLAKLIGKDGIAVIPTASTRVRSRDTDYPYRPDSDFYYFTGFKISYILYTIPCPQNSAPSNNIY